MYMGQAWVDKSSIVGVYYGHGKAVYKHLAIRVLPWTAKAREWFHWLRGFVSYHHCLLLRWKDSF
jgi:hypothetical protein